MFQISIAGVLEICKRNFLLCIKDNLFIAVVYLLLVPLLRGIENLDAVRSAECLEQTVIIIGIILIANLDRGRFARVFGEESVQCVQSLVSAIHNLIANLPEFLGQFDNFHIDAPLKGR